MKTTIEILKLVLIGFVLVGCSHDINFQTKTDIKKAEYKASFVKNFGKPASTQTWGFKASGTTRSANVNGNQWAAIYDLPDNITDTEKEKVVAEFSKKREGVYNTKQVTWSEYWVQQVYTGETVYKDGYGNDVLGSSKMNKLITYNSNAVEEIWWPVRETKYGGYEHINNFNSGSNETTYYSDGDNEKSNPIVGTTLMVGMESDGRNEQFGYHNSTDSKDHFEYIILEIDGSWYVGFDFYATHPDGQEANKNMDVDRDWIFNDWIVKISPAKLKGTTPPTPIKKVKETGRIMCEDLGTTDDFDFNDLVFDGTIYTDGTASVTILATGGTLPITIAGIDVHQYMGPMTTEGGTPVTLDLPGNGYSGLSDIPIIVRDNNEAYELTAPAGDVPHKICVPVGIKWMKERKNINLGYPDFNAYVSNTGQDYPFNNAKMSFLVK